MPSFIHIAPHDYSAGYKGFPQDWYRLKIMFYRLNYPYPAKQTGHIN